MKIRFLKNIVISFIVLTLTSCEEDLFFDDPRERLTGEWTVEEDSEIFRKKNANRYYSVFITKDLVDSTAFYIEGFYELSGKVKIEMDGMDLSIPEQTIDGFTIEDGSGEVSADYSSLTLYYYVSFAGDKDVVRADYFRSEDR